MVCLDSQGLGSMIGKLVCMTFSGGVYGQTTPIVKITVSHTVAHQNLTSAEDFNNQVYRLTVL